MESASSVYQVSVAHLRWPSVEAVSGRSCHRSTSPEVNSNMVAVASRIQERARNLMEEQHKLHMAHDQLEDAHQKKAGEITANLASRKSLLEGVIARHQKELELYRTQGRLDEQQKKNQQMQASVRTVKDKTARSQVGFQNELETVYALHQMEMERYRGVLDAKTHSARRSKIAFDMLKSNTQRLRCAIHKLRSDRKSIVEDCQKFHSEEQECMEDVSNLAKKVREALSKVRAARVL